jgi:hypothetical protein
MVLPSTLEIVPIEAFPPPRAAPGKPPPLGSPLAELEREPLARLEERPPVPPSAGGVNARAALEELDSWLFSTRIPA